MASRERRKLEKRARYDRMRNLRVVEYIDYGKELNDCPVEVTEGYIVSDIDDYSIFASFVFRNASGRRITSLKIRLLCYQNQNIPYLKIPFEYCYDTCTFGVMRRRGEKLKDKKDISCGSVADGVAFGECVYIRLPESYFKKLELELMSVTYDDGTEQTIGVIAGHSKARIGFEDKGFEAAYREINIYREAELMHPACVIPKMGTNAWLCCCGHKNSLDDIKCEVCYRERQWQLDNIVESRLKAAADAAQVAYTVRDSYKQDKYMQSEREIAEKVAQYERAMKNIAAEERAKERLKRQFIPRLIAAVVGIWLVAALVLYIASLIK